VESTLGKSKIRVEKYPLPPGLEGILSLMREILSSGRVQKVELELGKPVRVSREVDDGSILEPDVNLDGQLRNIEIVEYVSEGASPFQVVVDMMQFIRKEQLHCVCWASGDADIDGWLEFKERGMPSDPNYLLNLPVHHLRSLPSDALILCGSRYPGAEIEEISLAVKATVEIRRPNNDNRQIPNREADGTVGASSQRGPSAVDQLALAARTLRTVARGSGAGEREC